jgi:predicted GNAT family acetyltransferase
MSDGSQSLKGQFKIEREGQISLLSYETDGHEWISLLHTEVPPALRGRGIATALARMAFEYAKENHLKVEVICPFVHYFLNKNPEYKPLVGVPARPQS